ncbi:hypothetical protein N9437_03160 [Acidimicrobiia bacterium]|nr:hypothetical protein [Acidimicrobiia bacterium]
MQKVFTQIKKPQILLIFFFLIIDFFLVVEKKATIMTLLLLCLFFFNRKYSNQNLHFIYKDRKVNNIFIFFYLLTITVLTQNYLLNYEIIDWDISSYLVASNSVLNGALPYEFQWESKGPLLYYIYSLFIKVVSGNFVYFKLVNDAVLALVSFILYLIVNEKKSTWISIISSSIFILLFSQPWGVSAYSELYCLFFIALSYYVDLKFGVAKYIPIGILFALSTLVNQGSVLFLIPFLFKFFANGNIGQILKLLTSFIVPYIIVISLYINNNLLDVFIATYITIPLEYTSAQYSNFYELRVFLRKFFEYNSYLYFALITVIVSIPMTIKKTTFININTQSFDLMFITVSLIFYFVGSHNYYHHLLFLLFFISLYIQNITKPRNIFLVFTFSILSLISILGLNGKESLASLNSLDTVYEDYPLRMLADDLDEYFTEDFNVLALEYNLVLHYLEKDNYSYIVHHTNFLEPYIISALEEINYIEANYIEKLINSEPDVVICTEWMIVRGDPVKNPIINCSRDIFSDSYSELNTDKYFTENLNFYNDPYKKIKVFIKNN